jgi:flagellar biosynthetic protein FlhB
MADQDDASKTEDPTERRLEKGRDEGSVATSQEIKSWMILLGSAAAMMFMAPEMMRTLARGTLVYVTEPDMVLMDSEHLQHLAIEISLTLGAILLPFMGLMMVLALAASIGQIGFVYSPKKIEPKFSNLSMAKGFKRMFSVRSGVEFIKGILKIVVVAAVSFTMAFAVLTDIDLMPGFELITMLDRMYEVALKLIGGTVAVMTVIALLDFAYQKQSHTRSMRMTKQEVKDEHKQSEGDPMIKARIRRLRNERARQRMMAAVPRADVVITNPTHYAVALEYKMESMTAPRLIAKGVDSLAFRIREVAEQNDIPLVENAPLARALYAAVDLDQEIPPEHYKAVAEVIGYVMRLNGKLPDHGPARAPNQGPQTSLPPIR